MSRGEEHLQYFLLWMGVGLVCPPMVIHKGQTCPTVLDQWCTSWMVHCSYHKRVTSWNHKFHEYDIHFVCFLKKHHLKKEHHLLGQKHLLIIDSHKSHVYNVAFFKEIVGEQYSCTGHPTPYKPHCPGFR